MSKCPHCHKELPPMTKEDADLILLELEKIPEFMSRLGKMAAKQYIKDNQ